MTIITKTKVIIVTACKTCPYHTSSQHFQLDDVDSPDEYYIAEQHVCHKCMVGKDYPLTWWTDKKTRNSPAIQDECPLSDK